MGNVVVELELEKSNNTVIQVHKGKCMKSYEQSNRTSTFLAAVAKNEIFVNRTVKNETTVRPDLGNIFPFDKYTSFLVRNCFVFACIASTFTFVCK